MEEHWTRRQWLEFWQDEILKWSISQIKLTNGETIHNSQSNTKGLICLG